MAVKIGINGFGRIGRLVYRATMKRDDVEVVAVNDITDAETLAHLLKYDSVHGVLEEKVSVEDDYILVGEKKLKVFGEKKFKVFAIRNPEEIPWEDVGADIVIESTGLFRTQEKAAAHLKGGAKKVIISAPAKSEVDATFVLGVNEELYDPVKHTIVSNASCTTNCLAPVAKVLHENFTINRGVMTTIHSYTNDQKILDLPHKDLRRARAAALSMIPTTTGAAKAVGLVLPDLEGKLDGMAVRVPTPNVSLVDLVVEVETETTAQEVNGKMKAAAEGDLEGILGYSELPLVSTDLNHNPLSSIFDAPSTKVMDRTMIKVLSWYDNEFGYANRCVDLVALMAKSM
jgi:glyceraldehyde 3-phosphate dehydrogenase